MTDTFVLHFMERPLSAPLWKMKPERNGTVTGIVHFEINFWYVWYGLWTPFQRACTEKSKLNMI